ncbi:MAG: response regulator [Spirochaetales bacterium]|nr:response regulator [Spirochaetales bacterium]
MKIPESVYHNTILYSAFGVAILGSSGTIRMANKSLERMLNRNREELEGKDFSDFLNLEDQHKFRNGMDSIKGGVKDNVVMEVHFPGKDGEDCWYKLRMHLIPHPEKDSWILNLCLEDITEHYKLIQKLTSASRQAERARDEAELATRTKSEFLANTSHEIRTPIHTIIGMTELLLDTALDPEQQEYAEQVQFSADVLLSLINDILDFEKIEAGKLKLEAIEMGLYEILENAMDLVVLEGHRKGLEMILDIGAEVPDRIIGDPVRLRQILVNLVNNAIKFTASGEIHTTARLESIQDNRCIVKFVVRDTGIGISEAKKSKLFKEFSQVDSSTTRKYGGTGLGLSISKKLSKMMNGKIGVESLENEGSSFWFTAEFEALQDDDRNITNNRFPDHSVLIVDDNLNSLNVLKRYIEEWGCRVETATCGQDALEMLKAAHASGNPFKSCFVDLVMPRMDGWHFANEVKTSEDLKDTALFLLSPAGKGTIEPKMKLLNWFSDYLDKPVKRRKLFLSYCKKWEEGLVSEILEHSASTLRDDEMSLGNGNILVAEDHEVNQQLFKTILENLGQMVSIANNGLEAVRAVERDEFDIIFMDVQMPEMNGYEATMKIRELGVKIPIVAVTASAIKGEKDKCLSVGMTDFLTKPFKKRDISPVLYKYLGEEIACLEELEDGECLVDEITEIGELEAVSDELEPIEELSVEDESFEELPSVEESIQTKPIEEDFDDEDSSLVYTSQNQDDIFADLSSDPLDIFNLEEAKDTFMGKTDLVLKLLKSQVEKVAGQIPVMEDALAAEEWDTFRESAHSIKGGSWNLEAKQMGDCAFEAETAGKEHDGLAGRRALDRVGEAYRRFKTRAEEIVGESL